MYKKILCVCMYATSYRGRGMCTSAAYIRMSTSLSAMWPRQLINNFHSFATSSLYFLNATSDANVWMWMENVNGMYECVCSCAAVVTVATISAATYKGLRPSVLWIYCMCMKECRYECWKRYCLKTVIIYA